MFQCKTLHNILYAYKMLFRFWKVTSPQCSFQNIKDETIMHLLYECLIVKRLWNQLKSILWNNLIFPINTPWNAIFGLWDLDTNEHLILNHLLSIFKMFFYNARTTGYLNISHLLICLKDTNYTKKRMWKWCKKEKKNQ